MPGVDHHGADAGRRLGRPLRRAERRLGRRRGVQVEDDAEGVLEGVAGDVRPGQSLDAHPVGGDRHVLEERVLRRRPRRRGGQAVAHHLHLHLAGLALDLIARHRGELQHDGGHPLQVDDVEGHRELARRALGDGQALRLRPPLDGVAREVAVGLLQEVDGDHEAAALAAGHRLRQGDDVVADGDDGAAEADHHVLAFEAQREALAGLAGRQLAAQAVDQGVQAEDRPAGVDRRRHRQLAAVEHDGRPARRREARGGLRPLHLGGEEERNGDQGQDQESGEAPVDHAGEDTTAVSPALKVARRVW